MKKKQVGSCDDMQFNPMTTGSMLETYPVLQVVVLKEYEGEDLDKIIRYAILMYDPKSPLVQVERDVNNRRYAALDMAGIKAGFLRDELFEFRHPFIADLVFDYLKRFVRSREWAAIVALEFAYWESIRKLLEPISDASNKRMLESVQKKSQIKTELMDDIKRLDTLYKSFFGEDKQLEIVAKKRLTPETVAGLI